MADLCLSNAPLNPHHTRKRNTDPSRMPQPAPIKAVTQSHICNNNRTPRNRVSRRPATSKWGPSARAPRRLPPLHFTPQTQRRFYGVLGKQGRRGEAAACRRDLSCFSSSACERKTITHRIPTPAYLGGETRLTYGGAYVKLSSATSLIANHRVQTLLTSFCCLSPH